MQIQILDYIKSWFHLSWDHKIENNYLNRFRPTQVHSTRDKLNKERSNYLLI